MRSFPLAMAFILAVALGHAQNPAGSLDRDYGDELPRIAPLAPDEALKSFEIQPGFRMELVAAEPLVRDPVAMAFDADGRLYAVEMRGYSEQREENIGAVRLLEDADGDGVFDRSTAFLGNLAWPTAVACWDGGVFVGVAPDILYAKDTDGDGKADQIDRVFTGFGLQNVQGLLNTFKWGLNNRIHGATSSSGGNIRRVGEDEATAISFRGRDFSFDPRTLEIRPESGGGQHGLTFDVWGRKLVCSNSNHIQQIKYEDRYTARNPYIPAPSARQMIAMDGPQADVFRISPVEPWRIVRTRLRVQGLVPGPVEGGGTAAGYFTSATGITVYKGDAWGPSHVGTPFIGDVGGNLIHRKHLTAKGVELVARRMDNGEEFIASRDIWFRPVQFCNGPDGALYVADMYREVIEHPDSLPPIIKKHLDLTSGHDRGRIYRIVPENFQQREIPRMSDLAAVDIVPFLAHANAWHRETAARLLYEQQDVSVVPELEAVVQNSDAPEGRMHALYMLDGLGKLDESILVRALSDPWPWVRAHALRVSESKLLESEPLRNTVRAMVSDSNPNVRHQLAFTIGEMPQAERVDLVIAFLRHEELGFDPWWSDHALLTSLPEGSGEAAIRILRDDELRRNSAAQSVLAGLMKLAGTREELDMLARVLEEMDRHYTPESSMGKRLVTSLTNGLRQRSEQVELAALAEQSPHAKRILDALLSHARAEVTDEAKSLLSRVSAIRWLAAGATMRDLEAIDGLLGEEWPMRVHETALRTLENFRQPEVAGVIIKHWPKYDTDAQQAAIDVLLRRDTWTRQALQAVETGAIDASAFDSAQRVFLNEHPDTQVRALAQTVFGAADEQAMDELIASYQASLELDARWSEGRRLFREHCSSCHRLEGEGHDVGPPLMDAALKGADVLLVNILDPNREVLSDYVNYVVKMVDGRTLTGIMGSESATSLTLVRANGYTDTVLRSNIESIRSSELSIMPEDLAAEFSKQDMADLLGYLLSEKLD